MPQTIAVQQGDGRKDATDLALHKSAWAIKDFSKRFLFSHPLEDSSLNGEQGFCACALRYQHPLRTTSRSFPLCPAGAPSVRTISEQRSSARRPRISSSIARSSALRAARRQFSTGHRDEPHLSAMSRWSLVARVRWELVGLSIILVSIRSAVCAPRRDAGLFQRKGGDQSGQRDSRITLQKFPRWKCGSLSARTSALTLPNVVSGLCLMPS